jgi:C-terminal processing protease CtpA/Prc
VFDDLWHQVDLHYSFFALKGINWDSLGAVYRPLAVSATSDAALADVLSRMLAALSDVHVSLTPAGGATLRYVARFESAPTYFDASRVFRRYVTGSSAPGAGHVRFGRIASDVGYVSVPSFLGSGWADEMDSAIAALAGVTRMIVDVRDNGGGNQPLAIDVAGRFADRSRTFGYVRRRNGPAHTDFTDWAAQTVAPSGPTQFTRPVYMLANRKSASSAEDFVLAMRALPNVTVLGDTTAGAAGGPIVRELANGWTYQVSSWIEYGLDRTPFEGVGLAPDVLVKGSSTDWQHDSDPALERAVALAKAGP